MGLYLAIFSGEKEIAGLEVGSYNDFGIFRDMVTSQLEEEKGGSKFPTLINHSDCDGEWSPDESRRLEKELIEIGNSFKSLPPIPLESGWKQEAAKLFGINPINLYECFFDVDGEPLIERMLHLARVSIDKNLLILFQ